MIKPKFFGTVKAGRFVANEPDSLRGYLLKFEDLDVEITIEKKHKRRSSGLPGESGNLNGYYWAVVVRIVSDTMGELDDNATHAMLQMLFNKKGVQVLDPITKQKINLQLPKGTKDLSSAEFAEYCSRIRTWASIPGNLCERGAYIPEPHEATYDL